MKATVVFSVHKDHCPDQTEAREQKALSMLWAMGYRAELCDGKFEGKLLSSVVVYDVDRKDKGLINLMCETFEQQSVLVLSKSGKGCIYDKYAHLTEKLGYLVEVPNSEPNWTMINGFTFSFSKKINP